MGLNAPALFLEQLFLTLPLLVQNLLLASRRVVLASLVGQVADRPEENCENTKRVHQRPEHRIAIDTRAASRSGPEGFSPSRMRLVDHRTNQGDRDDDDRQGGERRIRPVADLGREGRGECVAGENGEHRGVVVLEGGQQRQECSRADCRAEERQQDLAERLPRGGTKIQRRFRQRRIEPLQAGKKHQHRIGGDKRYLTGDGEEHAVVKERSVIRPDASAECTPEHDGRDTENHSGNKDRRDQNGIEHGPQARPEFRKGQRSGQPHRNGNQHDADTDDDAVRKTAHQAIVPDQDAKPVGREAFPRGDAGEG